MNSNKIIGCTVILMVSLMINAFSNAQKANNMEDTIYSGVTVNLSPKKIHAARSFSVNLYNKIGFTIIRYVIKIKDVENYSLIKRDSMIIYLVSGLSWELTGQEPKTPPFFFFRLILNRKNVKVKRRYEYLKFNSICEQKPDLVYLLIDRIEVYETHEKGKYKYIMTLDANNDVIIQERISLK